MGSSVLLIDLENCPSQLQHLTTNLEQFSQVIICYATSHSKIPLDWLLPLSHSIADNKLKIVKMNGISKNAADFGICFLAGALMQELSQDTHFVIISNDIDLDNTVFLLKSYGRKAERVGQQKEKKEDVPIKQIPSQSPQSHEIEVYCKYLVAHSKNRPSKVEKLANSIIAVLKTNPSCTQSIYQELLTQGLITISNEKVIYNNNKLNTIGR